MGEDVEESEKIKWEKRFKFRPRTELDCRCKNSGVCFADELRMAVHTIHGEPNQINEQNISCELMQAQSLPRGSLFTSHHKHQDIYLLIQRDNTNSY